jgi:hypothetical protein
MRLFQAGRQFKNNRKYFEPQAVSMTVKKQTEYTRELRNNWMKLVLDIRNFRETCMYRTVMSESTSHSAAKQQNKFCLATKLGAHSSIRITGNDRQ